MRSGSAAGAGSSGTSWVASWASWSAACMVARPVAGALSLTLLLAAFFVVGGVSRIMTALAIRFPGRGWTLLSGMVTLLLGIVIWRQWPISGLWVIGTFVGLDLIFDGWSLVMLGMRARQ